jgi:hypothetical protein
VGLAGKSTCPDWQVFGSGPLDAKRESTDAGEEMTLDVPSKVSGLDFSDVALVNESIRQTPIGNACA